MSDINLDFTVSNSTIDFTVQPNDITFTPSDIQLTVYTSGAPLARGANMEVQYNNEGLLEGNPSFTFDQDVGLLSIANINTGGLQATGNVSIGGYVGSNVNIDIANVSNIKIGGGTNGYVLQTDGTGNLDWIAMGGGGGGNGTPGGSNTQIQYNDAGTFGGNAGFTFNEVSGLVNVPGNLTATGIITATSFVGNFIGNIATANFANFAGNVTVSSQPNITSLGTLTSLSVTGNSNTGNIYTSGVGGNISGANVISANYFVGNGSLLTGVGGVSSISNGTSNVNIATANGNVTVTAGGTTSLTVSNANVTARQFISNVATGTAPFAVSSNTVVANLNADLLDGYNTSTANTANTIAVREAGGVLRAVTFVGNGVSLSGVNADLLDGYNSSTGNTANTVAVRTSNGSISASYFIGNGSLLTGIVASTTDANNANYAGNVTISNQPNITTLGTLTGLSINGNLTATGNLISLGTNSSGQTNILGNVTIGDFFTASNVRVYGDARFGSGPIPIFLYANGDIGATGNYVSTLGKVTASLFQGSGANLNNIPGGNVTGQVQEAFVVTGNTQSNITAVGTLSSLVVSNNANVGNLRFTGTLSSNNTPNTAVSTTISHKLPIVLNGVTYFICLTSAV